MWMLHLQLGVSCFGWGAASLVVIVSLLFHVEACIVLAAISCQFGSEAGRCIASGTHL